MKEESDTNHSRISRGQGNAKIHGKAGTCRNKEKVRSFNEDSKEKRLDILVEGIAKTRILASGSDSATLVVWTGKPA